MAYRLTAGAEVLRLEDGACIPPDPENRDWRAFQAWLAEGNQPDPEEAPIEPAPRRAIRALAFRERLPIERRQAISVAAAQAAVAGEGAPLSFLMDQAASLTTDLDDPRVQGAIVAMEAAGLINEAEARALLADPQPEEL